MGWLAGQRNNADIDLHFPVTSWTLCDPVDLIYEYLGPEEYTNHWL